MIHTKTHPARLSNLLVGNFGELVNDLLNEDYNSGRSVTHNPKIEVHEFKDKFSLNVALPGIEKKDIVISQKENYLSIKGTYPETAIEDGKTIVSEFPKNSYERRILLPKTANKNEIDASLKNGILSITIAKQAELEPATIKIK